MPILVPFAPVRSSWGYPFLRNVEDARDFLSTAWQVQAAAVGFSLAVAVFALQAVANDRWRPTPRELARATRADLVLALGVASILVTGLALTGAGRGGQTGWSGSVAVTVAALSLLSVLPLWATSVSAVAGGKLRTIRLREITDAVQASVDRSVHERLALRILTELVESAGAEFSMFDLGPRRGAPVLSERAGYVADVNLRRLHRVLASHGAKVKVRAYLGLACASDSILARVSDDLGNVATLVRRSFKIKRSHTDDVGIGFKLLHHLATQALLDGDALAYEEVRSAYKSLLQIYPEAWSRFGRRFDADASGELNPFFLPVLSEVQRNLTRQIIIAAEGPNEELASEAVWLPGLVALDAVRLQANALFASMLDVIVTAHYQVVGRGKPGTVGDQLRNVLMQSLEYGPVRIVESTDETIGRRTEAADLVALGYRRVASVSKQLVDLDMAGELGRLLNKWHEFFRFLQPDVDAARWHLKFAVDRGEADPELEAAVSELESLASVRRRLDSLRTGYLLQLLGWVVHRLRVDNITPSAASQRLLAAIPGDVDLLLELAEIDRVDNALDEWIILGRVDDSSSGAYDSLGPLLDAIATVAIRSTDPGQPPNLASTARLAAVEQGLLERVSQMTQLWPWELVVPQGNQEARATALSEAIREAASQYRTQREVDIIEAPLDPVPVSAFVEQVRRGFEEARVVPRWLGGEIITMPREDDKAPVIMGRDTGLMREWFQSGAHVDVVTIADQEGHSLARSEASKAIGALLTVAPTTQIGDALEVVRTGIASLRAGGSEPNVVFIPRHLSVRRALNPGLDRRRDVANATSAAYRPIGIIDGVEVFESELLETDRLVVADLRKALRWHSTMVRPENEVLVIAIHGFPLDEAMKLAELDDSLRRETKEDDVVIRARRVAATVTLRTRLCAYIDVHEPDSVRAFKLTSPQGASSPIAGSDDPDQSS